jgi:hypothetical protein
MTSTCMLSLIEIIYINTNWQNKSKLLTYSNMTVGANLVKIQIKSMHYVTIYRDWSTE